MLASKSKCGFYDPAFNHSIPDDAVEITDEEHAALLTGQGEGKVITWGENGFPFLADPPAPSLEEIAVVERTWRDLQLAATDSIVTRHRDELEDGSPTSLTPDQYAELQAYRRQLRDWPEAGEFPLNEHRPAAPGWLAVTAE